MHELSIAATIMEDVLRFIEARGIDKVVVVRLAIGQLTCVQPEQLKFCYESITQETPLRDSKLEIETIGATVICPHCNYTGAPKYWMDSLADAPIATLQCPSCGRATEADQGHECAIKSIQYADN